MATSKAKKDTASSSIEIRELATEELAVCILGTTPLIFNAMSEKARHELLMPKGQMKASEKATNLKHNPPEEFRGSVYENFGDDAATRLMFPAGGFKKACMTAALEIPGATKASIGRLMWIPDANINIFGIPEVLMSITRSADMNKTPDVRTRAIVPRWACSFFVQFVTPRLNKNELVNLLSAAGLIVGIGDWRQEKGSGNYGQFRPVNQDNPEFMEVCRTGGREEQDAALADPTCHDRETARLYDWFFTEAEKRNKQPEIMARKKSA